MKRFIVLVFTCLVFAAVGLLLKDGFPERRGQEIQEELLLTVFQYGFLEGAGYMLEDAKDPDMLQAVDKAWAEWRDKFEDMAKEVGHE